MTATAPQATGSIQAPRSRARQLLAVSLGNAVEWFDWYVYSMLAVYFAGQFFPSEAEDSLVPLLSTLAIFAVGFLARPLGGLYIGVLADRFGRRRVLSGTVVGMGLGSLLIGLAPTYEQIGIAAPALLLFARLLQGFSAGGEYAAGSAFLVESAPEGRRGLFASFFYISATSANLLAIGISALLATTLSAEDMASWGWRIPFLLGSLAAVVGLWVRTHSDETLSEEHLDQAASSDRVRLLDFVRHHPKQTLQVFGLMAAPGLIFYVWTGFLATYANISVGLDVSTGLVTGAISLTVFLILTPLFGLLSDRIGRKPQMIAYCLFFIFATVPLLGSLRPTFASLLFVQLTGMVFIAAFMSITSAVFAELFPARLRSSGIGFPYALSVALFGGTGPYVATALIDRGHPSHFAWYIVALTVISALVVLRLPETAHKPLR